MLCGVGLVLIFGGHQVLCVQDYLSEEGRCEVVSGSVGFLLFCSLC